MTRSHIDLSNMIPLPKRIINYRPDFDIDGVNFAWVSFKDIEKKRYIISAKGDRIYDNKAHRYIRIQRDHAKDKHGYNFCSLRGELRTV